MEKGYKARDLEMKFYVCLGIYSITVPMMVPPLCPECPEAWTSCMLGPVTRESFLLWDQIQGRLSTAGQ